MHFHVLTICVLGLDTQLFCASIYNYIGKLCSILSNFQVICACLFVAIVFVDNFLFTSILTVKST